MSKEKRTIKRSRTDLRSQQADLMRKKSTVDVMNQCKRQGHNINLVLVDIKHSIEDKNIKCVKRSINDPKLKYIAVSYRWGGEQQLDEQLVETPDYTARITSFNIRDFQKLCWYIKHESDLKEMRYLWIDAISIHQQNSSKKKRTILQMSDIYKKAAYILAVPDLHKEYLMKNPANKKVMGFIYKHKKTIHSDIIKQQYVINNNNDNHNNNYNYNYNGNDNNDNEDYDNDNILYTTYHLLLTVQKNEEIKKAYQFLAYLIDDWSHRAWVISEYQIAKEKYNQHGTPLKYIFISLLCNDGHIDDYDDTDYNTDNDTTIIDDSDDDDHNNNNINNRNKTKDFHFFSLTFDHHDNNLVNTISDDNHNELVKFLTARYKEGQKLEMILESMTRNEDEDNNDLDYFKVDDQKKLVKFINTRLKESDHLEMILSSNTSKNEDRFYAILPLWEKYQHYIIDKNTILNWNISDILSVRLKLYEIMDDPWDRAKLLYTSTNYDGVPFCPSFACYSHQQYQSIKIIMEKDNETASNNNYLRQLECTINMTTRKFKDKIKQLIKNYETMTNGMIYNDNLIDIQFNSKLNYLLIKTNVFFMIEYIDKVLNFDPKLLVRWSLKQDDTLKYVYLPFFTFKKPCIRIPPLQSYSASGIYLLGNTVDNRWILLSDRFKPCGAPVYKLLVNNDGFKVY